MLIQQIFSGLIGMDAVDEPASLVRQQFCPVDEPDVRTAFRQGTHRFPEILKNVTASAFDESCNAAFRPLFSFCINRSS